MTKKDFVQMLESHDWTYERSDDHSKWLRGCEQRRRIMARESFIWLWRLNSTSTARNTGRDAKASCKRWGTISF